MTTFRFFIYICKVLSGGCVSATTVSQMAIYVDGLIIEYTKMDMPGNFNLKQL